MTYDTERWHTAVESSLKDNMSLVGDFQDTCPACRSLMLREGVSDDGAGGARFVCDQCNFGFVSQIDDEDGAVQSVRLLSDAMAELSDSQLERLLDRVGIEAEAFE